MTKDKKTFLLFCFQFFMIPYMLKRSTNILQWKPLFLLRRIGWRNRDAGVKWEVRKEEPAGKYGIKKADS